MIQISTYKELLNALTKKIINKQDAYELCEFITHTSKEDFLLSLNKSLSIKEKLNICLVFHRLKKGEPIPYIVGKKFFYNNYFLVNKHVLIPRNETEGLVEIVNRFLVDKQNYNVLDLCTGSGCIGISVGLANLNCKVTLSDLSKKALKVAKANTSSLNYKSGEIVESDFLTKTIEQKRRYNVIVVNPPYIDVNDNNIDSSVTTFEPDLALFAPNNGLKFYEELLKEINNIVDLSKPFLVACEFGWQQKDKIKELIIQKGLKYSYDFEKDLFGNWRYLVITN